MMLNVKFEIVSPFTMRRVQESHGPTFNVNPYSENQQSNQATFQQLGSASKAGIKCTVDVMESYNNVIKPIIFKYTDF